MDSRTSVPSIIKYSNPEIGKNIVDTKNTQVVSARQSDYIGTGISHSATKNMILSTNPEKLYLFVSSVTPRELLSSNQKNQLNVSLVHILPNIIYTTLMRSLQLNDDKTSNININDNIEFISMARITFENSNYLINCDFKDPNKLHIIHQSVDKQINLGLLLKINNPTEMTIKSFKKIVSIADKIFTITIFDEIANPHSLIEEILEVKYSFYQIVKFPNGVNLISLNNETYTLQYDYILSSKVDDYIKENIQFMINLISPKERHRIVQDDIFIDNYKHIMNSSNDKILKTINPIGISIPILLDKIDMSHCVFEKTDGERVHILIYDGVVCYINTIMEIYKIGDIDNSSINKVFDAELYTHDNQMIVFIFNLLYDNQLSNLQDLSLSLKLNAISEFLQNTKINTKFQMKVKSPIFNQNNKQEFFKNIHNMLISQRSVNIRTDGIIFQSILSTKKTWEKKIQDYKWKPVHETSLDFLVKIDNNRLKTTQGDYFKLNLFGFINDENGNESIQKFAESTVPVDPRPNEIASVYPVTIGSGNGESNLNAGEIICENSVVEFNPDFDELTGNISWIPYRIRMDKSLAVFYYKKKQGNSIETCKSTVEYLEMSINESDFESLGSNYELAYEQLSKRVQRIRVINRRDPIIDRLFDFVATNIFTSFARWSTFLKMYDHVDMCDLSCGNGINLFKIYEYAVLMRKNNFIYHGYNENRIQINSALNGAISRYERFRADKTYSNFPICKFNIYSIYEILEKVNTKYNHMMCLDAYTFQDSKGKIITISKIMRKLLVPNSFIFFILANKTFTIEDKVYNINCDFDTCMSIFNQKPKYKTDTIYGEENINYIVCEAYTLDEHVHSLDSFRSVISSMTNKKTGEFLTKTLLAYDKLTNLSLTNFRFLVLYRP